MRNYVGLQIDRYRIIERLGMGGMAVVYKAYDVRLERDVALKLIRTDAIPAEQHERLIRRFEREAHAMAKLLHPNIVQVLDFGDFEGVPYLVMPYLSGGTLKEYTGKPMNFRRAASLLAPIANALAFAHEQGVIHRDVKPANILITQSGTPMLSDFGIAKLLESQDLTLTSTGFGVGTPHYMAPEQWRNEVCPQTDIYALGTIFYELITCQKPYDAETPAAIAVKQATEPLVRPRTFISDLPEEVEKVIFKAMAFKPEYRYEAMHQFHNVLNGLAMGQQIQTPEAIDDRNLKTDTNNKLQSPELGEGTTQDLIDSSPPQKANIPEKSSSTKKHAPLKWTFLAGAAGILIAIIYIIFSDAAHSVSSGRESEPTQSITSNESNPSAEPPTLSSDLIFTQTPEIRNTATMTAIPTSTLGIGSTIINDIDNAELVYVPAGEFIMGSSDSDALTDEMPKHEVYLDAYWIYKNEVTYAQFLDCMENGGCNSAGYSITASNYPKIYVSWYEAQEYCAWAGSRLPTEAEWEKAARGTDGRKYPWGNESPTSNLANFYITVVGGTTPVGSYPSGASPYGALDMAGNVMEWVYDWYDSNYYQVSPDTNPTGPTNGSTRVFRGSSYYASALKIRTTIRHNRNPSDTYDNVGFRCVFDRD